MTVGRSASPTHQIGAAAEDAAAEFLRAQGFQVITTNFHSQFGEIDLIVKNDNLLLFIEVKHRKAKAQVNAAQSVTLSKQRKISRTAEFFLQQYPAYQYCDMRFDVIASSGAINPHIEKPHLEWIQGAFYAY